MNGRTIHRHFETIFKQWERFHIIDALKGISTSTFGRWLSRNENMFQPIWTPSVRPLFGVSLVGNSNCLCVLKELYGFESCRREVESDLANIATNIILRFPAIKSTAWNGKSSVCANPRGYCLSKQMRFRYLDGSIQPIAPSVYRPEHYSSTHCRRFSRLFFSKDLEPQWRYGAIKLKVQLNFKISKNIWFFQPAPSRHTTLSNGLADVVAIFMKK